MKQHPNKKVQFVESITRSGNCISIEFDSTEGRDVAQRLDFARVTNRLRDAIRHLEDGDSRSAVESAADAMARIALFTL